MANLDRQLALGNPWSPVSGGWNPAKPHATNIYMDSEHVHFGPLSCAARAFTTGPSPLDLLMLSYLPEWG